MALDAASRCNPDETVGRLTRVLRDLPSESGSYYGVAAHVELRRELCESLIGYTGAQGHQLIFQNAQPNDPDIAWSLRKAQGALQGAEYTEAARGTACGHIFRSGESAYHCKTCAADSTCVLCARCFAESDHEGHAVFVHISPGNSGCCDCGDDEAWVKPVKCSIHRARSHVPSAATGKSAQPAELPQVLKEIIRLTIGKALDYLCDVISCSPEQLRLPKTEESVLEDERTSRLDPEKYGGPEASTPDPDFVLVLWNDEKHTVDQVRDQVARACRMPKSRGLEKAMEVDSIGRSIVARSTDVPRLLDMAKILEQIKVSVTIRSARDTFREQMCATIIEWLADISGCKFGQDSHILRDTICSELFSKWHVGSPKSREVPGQDGIHDHEVEDRQWQNDQTRVRRLMTLFTAGNAAGPAEETTDNDDSEDEDNEYGEDEEDDDMGAGDEMNEDGEVEMLLDPNAVEDAQNIVADLGLANFAPDLRPIMRRARVVADDAMDIEDEDGNVVLFHGNAAMGGDMDVDADDTANEALEATMAGYPPPPPPPAVSPQAQDAARRRLVGDDVTVMGSQESDDADTIVGGPSSRLPKLPKTPTRPSRTRKKNRPQKHWLARPAGWVDSSSLPLAENLKERLRIDFLVLYDLRLWKTFRDELRHLYIGTVVSSPVYKRLMGIRFAGLYTLLAQLYLIADREPDHSIVNVSLQLLTTPSITAEVIERANFLTNLLAILYTFLTTREVGYPTDVLPHATLAFDAGAITNRRMFHFLGDAKYILQSTPAQEKLRLEPNFLLQFIDLVKLHQGICPNLRAVGEHVEYENDAWLSASFIVKEVNRLARFVADGFLSVDLNDPIGVQQVTNAIRELSYVTTISSLGLDSNKFAASEIKAPIKFRDVSETLNVPCNIPDIKVLDTHMSFHHPLHYLTSWLLQAAKSLPRDQVKAALFTESTDLSLLQGKFPDAKSGLGPFATFVKPHDWIAAMFDPPLRVCVWLAQMRASMWVRNGMTLRHQMHSYRSPAQRDITYQRDIFMLQAGMVLTDSTTGALGENFLLQIIHRFDLQYWLQGRYKVPDGYEEAQHIDVMEDFFHLLVTILTEREDLLPVTDHGAPSKRAVQRDLAHALCFKPLSYSDLSSRLTDRISDAEHFDAYLEEMTTYRDPGGLNDSGTYELKPEYIDMINPYFAFYSRNQREEADNIYRTYKAKQRGVDKAEVVSEPQLTRIESGLFTDLPAFTKTSAFAKILFSTLNFAVEGHQETTTTKARFESVLHIVLHLILIALAEDSAVVSTPSFIDLLVTPMQVRSKTPTTILSLLQQILKVEEYGACHPRIKLILKRGRERSPAAFGSQNLLETEPSRTSTPATDSDKELKRKQALERQAKVMAQFKAQQNDFMSNQGIDWDISDEEVDDAMEDVPVDGTQTETTQEYPSDACILCQEDTNDERLYGCFAFVSASKIQRQTPLYDDDYIQEVVDTPASLDRSAESIRPFGKAGKNKVMVEKTAADGTVVHQQQQVLSEGFQRYNTVLKDHVMTSCGHIMHYSCFEAYENATQRRHAHQISRLHPERLGSLEFICPLCKALGNVFLPILWKPRKESYPGLLNSPQPFEEWLAGDSAELITKLKAPSPSTISSLPTLVSPETRTQFARDYVERYFNSTLRDQLLKEGDQSPPAGITRFRAARALVSMLDVRNVSQELGISRTNAGASTTTAAELGRAYKLLNSSLQINRDKTDSVSMTEEPLPMGQILQTIASTVASIEIKHRGTFAQDSLLTGISEHTLIGLRILCETAASMFAIETMRDPKFAEQAHLQESLGLSTIFGLQDADDKIKTPSFLRYNTFWSLTACTYLPGDEWQRHGSNLIQLALMNEMVKVVLFYQWTRGDGAGMENGIHAPNDDPADPLFVSFFDAIARMQVEAADITERTRQWPQPGPITPYFAALLQRIVVRHALIFLRKVTILLHARSGIVFSAAAAAIDPELPELDRLCSLLRINNIPTLIKLFFAESGAGQTLRATAKLNMQNDFKAAYRGMPRFVDHPAIFELVGLPKNFDMLSEEAVRRRCPTTGKHMTDPVVCLFCGDVLCSQASCCRGSGDVGGASQHMEKCGNPVGLFINIRKCMVVFLHQRHGSFGLAPYLDKHGEVDPTLRRQHQLFLNQKRYDKLLRDVWLSHGIPSVISRKLEGDINTGGWESL